MVLLLTGTMASLSGRSPDVSVVAFASDPTIFASMGGGLIIAVFTALPAWVRSYRKRQRVWDQILGVDASPGVPGKESMVVKLDTLGKYAHERNHDLQNRFQVQENYNEMIKTRLTAIESHTSSIEAIQRELHPNGGSSMRDSIDRNERITLDTKAATNALATYVNSHIAEDKAMWLNVTTSLLAIASKQDTAATTAVEVAKGLADNLEKQ